MWVCFMQDKCLNPYAISLALWVEFLIIKIMKPMVHLQIGYVSRNGLSVCCLERGNVSDGNNIHLNVAFFFSRPLGKSFIYHRNFSTKYFWLWAFRNIICSPGEEKMGRIKGPPLRPCPPLSFLEVVCQMIENSLHFFTPPPYPSLNSSTAQRTFIIVPCWELPFHWSMFIPSCFFALHQESLFLSSEFREPEFYHAASVSSFAA